jgi:hypothetical protein
MLFLMYLQFLHAGHSVAWNDCGGEEFDVKLYRSAYLFFYWPCLHLALGGWLALSCICWNCYAIERLQRLTIYSFYGPDSDIQSMPP